jgi:hypothetical protein
MPEPFAYTTQLSAIPTRVVIRKATGEPLYECPESCSDDHTRAWAALRKADPRAPCPMPMEHCMFDDPDAYDCVPYHPLLHDLQEPAHA